MRFGRTRRQRFGALLGAACVFGGMLMMASGCLNLSADQCTANTDCPTNYVCSASRVCVKPATANGPVIIAADSGPGCTTTAKCTQDLGVKAVCRTPGSPCVPIQTDACPIVVGAWDDPNAVFLATMTQARTNDTAGNILGLQVEASVHMALVDVTAAGNLPGSNHSQRPVAGVFCTLDALKPDALRKADDDAVVNHLVKDVKAAAVFPQDEHSLIWAVDALTQTKPELFTMCAYCQSELSKTWNKGDQGLIWRALPPFSSQGEVWGNLLSTFEQKVRADPGYKVPPSGIRVALATASQNEFLAGLPDVIKQTVKANGALLTDPANQGNYIETANENWVKNNSSGTVFVAAQKIAQFKPHVVLVSGDIEGARLLIPIIESLWPADQSRPYYIAGIGQFVPDISHTVGTNESLRRRLAGVIPTQEIGDKTHNPVENFLNWVPHLLSATDGNQPVLDPQVPHTIDSEAPIASTYDSVMSVLMAIAASPAIPPSAFDIKNAFSRIVGGPGSQPVDLNGETTPISTAFVAFNAGQNIQLYGTYSLLHWNLTNSYLDQANGGWCLDRDQDGNVSISGNFGPIQTQLGGPFTGAIPCF